MNVQNIKQIQLIYSQDKHQNPLRQLINITRGLNNEKIQFSYLQKDFVIFKGTSIREFLTIETGPKTFGIIEDDLLLKAIEKSSIPTLKELYFQIKDIETPNENISQTDLKLCGIIKTIMQNKTHLFLDHPEKHLSHFQLELLKKTLKELNQGKTCAIKIYSHNIGLWGPFVDAIYETTPNGINSIKTKEVKNLKESA